MNKLDSVKRAQVVSCLVEGNSIRATVRMTGVAKNTVVKLLCDLGHACSDYQDKAFVNLKCKRLQCDEIWSFVGAKEKNCSAKMKAKGAGDVWTWTALDAETKLIPCWFVGHRDAGCAYHFIHDLKARLVNRVQLTTDGHRAYLSAVEDAFGAEIDYAMLQKIYGTARETPETRYSPAICMGARKAVISGSPDHKHVSTSYVERQNHHANVDAPIYSAHQRIFKEVRKPRARAGALFHVLQLLPDSPDIARDACDGSGHCRSRMGN
jgi:IS1 family transposase